MVHDNRGSAIREISYCRHPDTVNQTDERITRHHYHARGYLECSIDARLYEPQSIEEPKGFPKDGEIASGGNAAFSALNEQCADRWHKVAMKSGENTFKWTLTAKHSTASWKFFITKPEWDVNKPLTRADFDLTPFCQQDDNGKIPTATVELNCNIPECSGYQVILGVWNIADTANAFYQVIDAEFEE